MNVHELIEAFKRKEYRWDEKTQEFKDDDVCGKWAPGEINLYAVDMGGYDCTDELRVEFKDGKIFLVWDDRTYNDDVDLIGTETHRIELVEKND